MWDKRKSNQGKGDFWAPCPFHHEKTASFHVDDRKGFYYCFGCHAKGDVIGFVKDTENVSFMEAIELLAREAGMSVPRPDPKSQERTDKRAELADVMEEAVKYFRMSLKTGAAAAARDYLNRRGLKQEGQDRFEIGFAPNDRKGLFAALTGRGISAQHLIDSGMCIKPDDGGEPYDRFRGRIMFPIRDARGRCIAFGGRAMDPNARAKYLNSPETILFDKGRSLYHHGPARAAVGRGQPLIVAEGYMDVIALALGGFEGSVAPLGTAITEHQLNLMWQISPEPIIALDGDKAGLRAAYRLIDVALPMLQTGRALRFALMPQGQDPDDLIRAKGPQAVQDVLDNALSLVELMWQRETEGQNFDSPDRRASLDKRLRDALMQITDKSLRSHYGQAMRDLRWDLFRPKRSGKKPWSAQTKQRAHATTRASVLVQSDGDISQTLREAVIVAVVLKTPQVIERFYDDLVMLELGDRTTAEILGLLLELRPTSMDDAIAQLSSEIPIDTLERFMRQSHLSVIPSCKKPGNIDLASMTLQEELVKLAAHKGLLAELNEAFEIPDDDLDDTVLWRLGQAADAQNRAARPDKDDVGQFDMGENGARINRDERSKLDALIQTIRYDKRKK
jgi:DNA primase